MVIVGALQVSPAAGDVNGEPFNGTFVADSVRPPDCTSPVGICTRGVLYEEGSARPVATYDFVMTRLWPTGDGTKFAFTGRSVITKLEGAPGQLFAEDAGEIEMRVNEPSPFVTNVHVSGGTETYLQAQGLIIAVGELDSSSGRTTGTYAGRVSRSR